MDWINKKKSTLDFSSKKNFQGIICDAKNWYLKWTTKKVYNIIWIMSDKEKLAFNKVDLESRNLKK